MTASWSRRDKIHALLLLLITVGAVVHHTAPMFHWYVEDAAIDFAYAQNVVNGEGLVAYPGGERVEGYSNPTWLAVLVAITALGLDPFTWVHWIQLGLAIATVPLVYLAAREGAGKDSDVPIVATAFLAANSQFAIWGVCGLENALLHLLFALGLWRTLAEVRTGAWPWSALVWCLVALTRPEGIVYAAAAGFCAMVFQLHARRSIRTTLAWLATFFVPWTAYQAWHLWYFAWPLPNTYYAKLDKKDSIYEWNKRPWNWTRSFFLDLAQAFFLPIWILGVVGEGRWRTPIAAAAFLVVGLVVELSDDQRWLLPVIVGSLWIAFWLGLKATEEQPPRWLVGAATIVGLALVGLSEVLRYQFHMQPNLLPVPAVLKTAPPTVLGVLALLLPVVGYGARGWQSRLLSWVFCCVAIFFAVYAQGDWMKGYRWYAMASVPGSILFAHGVDSFVRVVEDMYGRVEGRPRWTVLGTVLAAVLVLLQLPANVAQTVKVAGAPDASPKQIKARVDWVDRLRDRLHLEERVVDLDVDQGAHLYWSDFEMMDIAGLVDVPLAHHRFEKAFVREYVFEERKPHYAHVHGNWASHSKLPTHPEWRRDYVEIPGYVQGRAVHPGNFLRKDAILGAGWTAGDDGRVLLEGGVVVHGVRVPSEPAAGRRVYVEVGLASTRARRSATDDFRVLLFASDGTRLHVWDVPPGYDWLTPHEWPATSSFLGRFTLPLPESLLPGTYDLGVVVLANDGTVLLPASGEDRSVGPAAVIGGEEGVPPRLAVGEIRWPGALVILSVDERAAAARQDLDQALAHAESVRCEEAERSWFLARKHRAGEEDWLERNLPFVKRAVATCWAKSSDGQPTEERVRRLVRAREWDWHDPEYRSRAVPLADELAAAGDEARARADWEAAYRSYSDCVEVDRMRSWCRRRAEEARAFRLGFDPQSLAQRKAEQDERTRKAEENRKRLLEKQAKTVDARPSAVQPAVDARPSAVQAAVPPPGEEGEEEAKE